MGLDAHVSRSTDRWCISDVVFARPVPARALDLDRRALQRRPRRLAAPDGRCGLAARLPDARRRRPRSAEPARGRRRPLEGAARPRGSSSSSCGSGPISTAIICSSHMKVGRVFFAGDSAHVVSPFGARGGNNGIQDAANLGWKLALVVRGEADAPGLLESYDAERHAAAEENLRVARRTTRFLAPRNRAERRIRQAVIDLARSHALRAQAGRYRPHGGGQRLPAVAVGERGVGLAAERVRRRQHADGAAGRRNSRFVGFWFGAGAAGAAACASLEGRWPLVVRTPGDAEAHRRRRCCRAASSWCGPTATSRPGSRSPAWRQSSRRCRRRSVRSALHTPSIARHRHEHQPQHPRSRRLLRSLGRCRARPGRRSRCRPQRPARAAAGQPGGRPAGAARCIAAARAAGPV